jgi:Family of unknown function (DUF6252)
MKYLIKFCFIIIILSSCQLFSPKPESEAFYCKINGIGYRPEKKTLPTASANPLIAEWNKKGRFNILTYNNAESIGLSVKLEPNVLIKIGNYPLQKKFTETSGDYFYNRSLSPSDRLLSINGNLKITKLENNLISGTFEFTCYSEIKKKTYKITKGQFNDLRYSEF